MPHKGREERTAISAGETCTCWGKGIHTVFGRKDYDMRLIVNYHRL